MLEHNVNHEELCETELAKVLIHLKVVPLLLERETQLEATCWGQHVPKEFLNCEALRICHSFIKVLFLHSKNGPLVHIWLKTNSIYTLDLIFPNFDDTFHQGPYVMVDMMKACKLQKHHSRV